MTTTSSIEELVGELRRELPRGVRRRDLLAEIRGGLQDAADAHRSAGLTPAEAERRAIDEFGDVSVVAGLCREEIGAGSTMRSAILVAIGYPVILGLWDLFYLQFGSGAQTGGGRAVGDGFTLIGMATTAVAIAAAWLTGRRSRKPGRSRRALTVGFAAMTVLSIGLTYLLAAVTHARPDAAPDEALARTLVQQASLAVTVAMLVATGSAARHALSSTRPHFSNRIC